MVINRVLILAILVINRVCFMLFLEEAFSSSLPIRPSAIFFHKPCLWQLCQLQRSQIGYRIFVQVTIGKGKSKSLAINRVSVLESGPHTHYPIFLGIPPTREFNDHVRSSKTSERFRCVFSRYVHLVLFENAS